MTLDQKRAVMVLLVAAAANQALARVQHFENVPSFLRRGPILSLFWVFEIF